MDHLLYPQQSSYPQIKIPYLTSGAVANYDGDDFIAFPSNAGWQNGDGEWYDCEPSLAAARTQSWLFFGLLSEILGTVVHEPDFVAKDDEQNLCVTTESKLPLLLRKHFRSKVPPLLHYFGKNMLVELSALLTFPVGLFLKDWLRRKMVDAPPKLHFLTKAAMVEAEKEVRRVESTFLHCEDVQLVCLSVRALLWSLRNAAANRDFTILMRGSLELSSSAYLKRLLVERGMCPHHLNTLEKRSAVATLYYLSGLHRTLGVHQQ